MNNLCIDIGNTSIKTAIFYNYEMIHYEILGNNDPERLIGILYDKKIENAIFSSVAENAEAIKTYIRHEIPNIFELETNTLIPIENCYETPDTLGKDRLAAVIGANYLYPGHNLLVIDAGTAITYDFINEKGQYLGGNISPGVQMRFQALHSFTKRLPHISPAVDFPVFGKNTTDAIRVGVQSGIINEVDGTITSFQRLYPDLKVLLTGGDTKYFDNKLKNLIFVVSNLVMIGLNRILIYNVQNS